MKMLYFYILDAINNKIYIFSLSIHFLLDKFTGGQLTGYRFFGIVISLKSPGFTQVCT